MSYLDRRLGDDETIVHRGRFHWFGYLQAWLALFVLGIIVIGIYIFAKMMIRRLTTEMVITNRRVVMKRGLIAADVDSLALEAVESVQIKESILGRILGFGKITVSGKGDLHVRYPAMAKPAEFGAALESARSPAAGGSG